MSSIFVDTQAWVALSFRRDQWHGEAVRINRELLRSGARYITTNYILDETYTVLQSKAGHGAAVEFGEIIKSTCSTQVIHISEILEEEAWKLFKSHSDKDFSFTDCTSFVVMKHQGLSDVFTNDHHFEQMGYRALLK